MITILDYGRGNLRSVQKAFERVGYEARITQDPASVRRAENLVLPGQGAFADCMKTLKEKGLADSLADFIASGRPYLGICLGLQILFEGSEEHGRPEGLGLVEGRVRRFALKNLKVPHMGWNTLAVRKNTPPLAGVGPEDRFYFVHSYRVEPADPSIVATTTDYGGEFVSSIAYDNVFACQYHPEKSQRKGLEILRAFAEAAA